MQADAVRRLTRQSIQPPNIGGGHIYPTHHVLKRVSRSCTHGVMIISWIPNYCLIIVTSVYTGLPIVVSRWVHAFYLIDIRPKSGLQRHGQLREIVSPRLKQWHRRAVRWAYRPGQYSPQAHGAQAASQPWHPQEGWQCIPEGREYELCGYQWVYIVEEWWYVDDVSGKLSESRRQCQSLARNGRGVRRALWHDDNVPIPAARHLHLR